MKKWMDMNSIQKWFSVREVTPSSNSAKSLNLLVDQSLSCVAALEGQLLNVRYVIVSMHENRARVIRTSEGRWKLTQKTGISNSMT